MVFTRHYVGSDAERVMISQMANGQIGLSGNRETTINGEQNGDWKHHQDKNDAPLTLGRLKQQEVNNRKKQRLHVL
jgi:hypothetical protein